MRVILLKDIKGLGRKNDIKEIANGYARNFLLARGLAKIADEKSIKEIENKKFAAESHEKEIKEIFEAAAQELNKREFIFNLKIGKKGEVYSSINKDEIKEKILNEISGLKKFKDYLEINLEKPVRALGEYLIEIDFGKSIKGEAKIKIISSQ